jgi:hypothetical protein
MILCCSRFYGYENPSRDQNDVRAYYAKTKNITQHTFALDLSISLKDQLVKYHALFIVPNNITGTCDFTEDNIWLIEED